MNKNIKKLFFVMLVTFSMILTSSSAVADAVANQEDKQIKTTESEDIDPLVDLKITVTIKEIRAFDRIDLFTDPDFYIKLFVNEQEFKSDVWENQKYVEEEWKQTVDVPDDKEIVNITIQLWDANPIKDKLCDIAKNDNRNPDRHDLTLKYSLKTGHWEGDDHIPWPHDWSPDYSGYGRASGTDDNSIYEYDRDCEIWFDINQTDFDGDGIPYWTEVNVFGTDPTIDDTGRDDDNDGVPIEWEYKWGYKQEYDRENQTIVEKWVYDPFEYENHASLDPDGDGLSNYEEYLTSQWGSDPFRKDVFVELDQMNGSSDGSIPPSILPNGSKDLIRDAFNRQNIVFHLDDGSWGEESESEMIPFDDEGERTNYTELYQIYDDYFLHGDENNWRKGVFHYGLVVYKTVSASGFLFKSDAFQISSKGMELKASKPLTHNRDVVYASAYMHELGHSLGLTWLLGHDALGKKVWHPLWWMARPYRSIMNYGYMYGFLWNLVDYSDGSRGKNDYDDWSNIDYSYFEQ